MLQNDGCQMSHRKQSLADMLCLVMQLLKAEANALKLKHNLAKYTTHHTIGNNVYQRSE